MNEAWLWLVYVAVFLAFVDVVYTLYRLGRQDDEDFSPDSDIIKIKYLADIMPLEKTAHGDWIDLRCAEDTVFEPGQYKAIPLGVAIKLPTGYEAIIAPRSSLFKRHGIMAANSIGVIDETYCGNNDEWHFLAYATKSAHIAKDERICQFRVVQHMPWMDIQKVAALDAPDRGGIGSSGRM
jgi:dUTP pyrophosphatase